MSAADEWDDLYGEWGRDVNGVPLPLTVETYAGPGQLGPRYDAPLDLPGLVQFAKSRLVRASDGNEALSTTTVYAPLEHRGRFALHSRVTLATGRKAIVLSLDESDTFGLFGLIGVAVE